MKSALGAVPTATYLPYCCPLCKGQLDAFPDARPERYWCDSCMRDYPVVLGIPDFRVYPDPYISPVDDYAKGRRLARESAEMTFTRAVERYWEITPNVPASLIVRYVRHALGAVERGRDALATLDQHQARLNGRRRGRVLDVGCGTGGGLISAALTAETVVGVDIAFRWLTLARKRIAEATQQGALARDAAARIQLVCCCGEYLPFAESSFDAVIMGDVIAHAARQDALLLQVRRALQPGGLLFLSAPNRFSITPEPHIRVWGVGFLPRRWMRPYVRLIARRNYEHIRLLSIWELSAMLRRSRFRRWSFSLPSVGPTTVSRYSRAERWGVRLYRLLVEAPGARQALLAFGPFYQAVAVAPEALTCEEPA